MSEIPFVKTFEFEYGVADALSAKVRRVIAKNPGPFTYTGSGTYIVGEEGPLAIIDPGPDNSEHIEALSALVGDRLSHILITHTHSDHCGGAQRLAELTGAPIYGFGPHPRANDSDDDISKLEEGGDLDYAPDHTVRDGDTIAAGDWSLEAIHTPGHISNHLCFAFDAEKALFTGDHVMGWATTVIIPPAGHMGDYMASLDRLLERDDQIYYPTHGAPITNPRAFVRAVRTHRLIRDRQILDQLRAGRRTIADIVDKLYADIDPRLHKAAAVNVFAHLIRLVETGAVKTETPAPGMRDAYKIAS